VRRRKAKRSSRGDENEDQDAENPFENEEFCLSPMNFFSAEVRCFALPSQPESLFSNVHRLPDLAQTLGEESFSEVFLGWNSEGIRVLVHANKPFEEVQFPEIQQGDSVELFFDTRNVKTSSYNTRFCHHFFFLPEPMEGKQAGELTRFRTEEAHEWCDPADLQVKAFFGRNYYTLDLFIPAHCLHGYDPDQFDLIGFTYRINRCGGSAQHFSVSSEDYQIEEQPSLWSSLRLTARDER